MRRVQAGDRAAFDLLMGRHHYRLESLVRLRLGHRLRRSVDVEDVLQETFTRAFVALPEFQWRDNRSFFHWLGAISEHVIKAYVRRQLPPGRGRRVEGGGSGHPGALLPASGVSPSKAMQRDERFDRLERALRSLNPPRRQVILLARVHGLRIKEIAERMGRSPTAVSVLLLRALRQLKRRFGHTESFHLPARSLAPSGGERPGKSPRGHRGPPESEDRKRES